MSFFNGDIGKIIEKNPSFENKIKCIIIDPPRSGVAKKSLKKIVNLNSKGLYIFHVTHLLKQETINT